MTAFATPHVRSQNNQGSLEVVQPSVKCELQMCENQMKKILLILHQRLPDLKWTHSLITLRSCIWGCQNTYGDTFQLEIICSKLTIETLEQSVRYVQS